MKTYKQFKIFTNPINVDLVSGLLWQLDIDGINETDSGLFVFVGSSKNVLRDDNENQIKSFSIE
jgi:hypothetical protein